MSEKSTSFTELTSRLWTYELCGQGEKKNCTKSRQTNTSHCPTKTISKTDVHTLNGCNIAAKITVDEINIKVASSTLLDLGFWEITNQSFGTLLTRESWSELFFYFFFYRFACPFTAQLVFEAFPKRGHFSPPKNDHHPKKSNPTCVLGLIFSWSYTKFIIDIWKKVLLHQWKKAYLVI